MIKIKLMPKCLQAANLQQTIVSSNLIHWRVKVAYNHWWVELLKSSSFFFLLSFKHIFGQLVVVITTFNVEYTGRPVYFALPVHFSTINTISRYHLPINLEINPEEMLGCKTDEYILCDVANSCLFQRVMHDYQGRWSRPKSEGARLDVS